MQYHHIEVKTNSPLKPKRFIGTALRGAFGHMLKAGVCDQPHYDCDICTAKEGCLYNACFIPDDSKMLRGFGKKSEWLFGVGCLRWSL